MSHIRVKNINMIAFKSQLSDLPEQKLLINTINSYSYTMARKDILFAEALLKGGELIPDGAGIVMAFKWLKKQKIERIAGWDLFLYEMQKLNTTHKLQMNGIAVKATVFFLGSSDKVLAKIKDRAAYDYPNIEIYTFSPPFKSEFTKEDNQKMIDAINMVQPNLLWIGMTAPKQEKWAYLNYDNLDVNGHIGTIGAVFDFYAGTIKRAPLWWQVHSIEWLYRLINEPKRMWKRYLIGNVKFIFYIINEKFNK